MEPEARQVHIGHNPRGIQTRQDVSQLPDVRRIDSANVIVLEETPQAFVAYRANHVECNA
jgi:hypothetical protein